MKKGDKKELTDNERFHIEKNLDHVRRLVRNCSEERMPQGPCKYCLEIYRSAVNKALDLGVYE